MTAFIIVSFIFIRYFRINLLFYIRTIRINGEVIMSSSSGAIRAGRAFVELFADNTRLQQGLRLAEAQLKEFGAKVSTMGRQIATISIVPLIPAGIGTKIFAWFDDQMRAVQGVTGSTGEAFDRLTEKAKLLGRTTSFTAKEVASGMLELGRAGFKSDEIDAAIAHVMSLARATQTEIPRATEIAGNALRGFGLEASEMRRVSDVLATTANNSAQTLDDLGEAFKYVAPIAATAGMSLEDTAKVLGTLANFGIKGSLAGTAVKNILTRMADPDIQAKYESLGIKVKDAGGNLRNMADVLKEVGIATANLPNAEKLAIFKELFDMRALAGGAKLTSESFESLCNAIDNAAGESARVAKTMDEGIGGAFRMFLSAAEGMAIAIGGTLAP
ncbi:MAG: phage tail tape measure protein, partial [Thermoguttaceae bacterium]|nr:phage tail tape measure protein [Thermoguttaceae bacterium]